MRPRVIFGITADLSVLPLFAELRLLRRNRQLFPTDHVRLFTLLTEGPLSARQRPAGPSCLQTVSSRFLPSLNGANRQISTTNSAHPVGCARQGNAPVTKTAPALRRPGLFSRPAHCLTGAAQGISRASGQNLRLGAVERGQEPALNGQRSRGPAGRQDVEDCIAAAAPSISSLSLSP